MTLIFIKFKDGCAESHEIEKFVMEGSTIRVETKDDIFFSIIQISKILKLLILKGDV